MEKARPYESVVPRRKGCHVPIIYLEKEIYEMDQAEIESLPVGVITLDGRAQVKAFNGAGEMLGRYSTGASVGLNFFHDVAPCAAVRDFQGRFMEFVADENTVCEEFRFVLRFAWGDKEVGITFVRAPAVPDKYFVIVNAYAVEIQIVRKDVAA